MEERARRVPGRRRKHEAVILQRLVQAPRSGRRARHGPFQCRFSSASARRGTVRGSLAPPLASKGKPCASPESSPACSGRRDGRQRAAAAAPARASTFYYVFETTTSPYTATSATGTGLCLEADPGPDFAYRVETQPCNLQNPAQQWTQVAQGGAISKLVNHAVGWCLDAHVPTPNINGAPVILWDWATFSDERWQFTVNSLTSSAVIESRAWNTSGYYLTPPGGQILPGLWTQLQPGLNPSQILKYFLVST